MDTVGKAWKFGDNVYTDQMIHSRYVTSGAGPKELARYLWATVVPDLAPNLRPGDVIVGGRNFGCGAIRLQAILALKAAEIGGIVAESFARGFYRNAINQAIPILECPGVADKIRQGDSVRIDLQAGLIHDLTTGERLQAAVWPPGILRIYAVGGLLPYTVARLGERAASPGGEAAPPGVAMPL